jgi:hypothetical protein
MSPRRRAPKRRDQPAHLECQRDVRGNSGEGPWPERRSRRTAAVAKGSLSWVCRCRAVIAGSPLAFGRNSSSRPKAPIGRRGSTAGSSAQPVAQRVDRALGLARYGAGVTRARTRGSEAPRRQARAVLDSVGVREPLGRGRYGRLHDPAAGDQCSTTIGAMVTIDAVRAVAQGLPRSYEVIVRGRVKFRVGQIVWLAFSRDETIMGSRSRKRSATG